MSRRRKPARAHARARAPRTPALLLLAVLTVAAAGCGDAGTGGESGPATPAKRFDRAAPNVVVVMTDDQALDTMRAMPATRRLIGQRGTRFTDAIVSFPLCCPSRASFLTGRYAHNHGVLDNGPPKGGIGRLNQERTLPVWLSEAGYRTGFVGKYLNGYGKERNGGERFIPPGWSEWYAATAKDKKSPYDYALNENGDLVQHGDEPADYKTDVFADRGVRFVSRDAGKRPFFLWVATSAPHSDNGLPKNAPRNPLPAPRDLGSFAGTSLPKPPSFNERDVSDKPQFVRELPQVGAARQREMRRQFVSELESLRAVDRLVARLVRTLRAKGELENTIFAFTSDNGYLRGQHRIDSGKSKLYDESIRVPLLVRGPGFPAGRTVAGPVANVDLTATIVAAAGVDPPFELDGMPLERSVEGPGRRDVLIEVFERKQDRFAGVRTARFLYAEHDDGETELYDRRSDPYELRNVAGTRRYAQAEKRLAALLAARRDCAGESCLGPG